MRNWLLDSIYDSYQKMVAKGRRVKPERVRQWIDGALTRRNRPCSKGSSTACSIARNLKPTSQEVRRRREVRYEVRQEPGAGEIDFSSPVGLFQFWASLLEVQRRKPRTRT